jgi:cell fate regulator YaaT (PSP1 superfamily)
MPNNEKFEVGEKVIVDTARGQEMGEVAIANKIIERKPEENKQPQKEKEESTDEEKEKKEDDNELRPIIRRATDADMKTLETNKRKEADALRVCAEKVKLHGLEMKLLGAHYTFDRSKVIFYFTADGRVDFRDLVKTLASVLRMRIELRQVGVRDEAKILGGIGICGRTLCCGTFLRDFEPISVKNAKDQGLSLNPTKISGCCGRLMCCLKFEQVAYDDLMKTLPGYGAIVSPKEGDLKGQKAVVENMYVLRSLVKARFEKTGDVHIFKVDDVNVIKRGSWRQGDNNSNSEEVDEKELKGLEG